MIGKLIGGIVCVTGIGGFIYSVTRSGNQPRGSLVSFACAGIAGLALFILFSRLGGKSAVQQAVPAKPKKLGQNALAWVILLGMAALFIGFILTFTG